MTDPVISNVQTINPKDFDSISDEVIDERDDEVVYMRYVGLGNLLLRLLISDLILMSRYRLTGD